LTYKANAKYLVLKATGKANDFDLKAFAKYLAFKAKANDLVNLLYYSVINFY